MEIKNKLFLVLLVLCLQFELNAQENTISKGFGFGYHILQMQNDFGIGLNVASPYFVNGKMGVRLKYNVMFNQSIIEGTTEWAPYSNFSLGLIGVGGYVNEKIRLYGEGGLLFLLPSNKISTNDTELGGYGLFGFEFFFLNNGNYYIEIGGAGTGATADKIINQPIYSNGLIISAGLRFFLK